MKRPLLPSYAKNLMILSSYQLFFSIHLPKNLDETALTSAIIRLHNWIVKYSVLLFSLPPSSPMNSHLVQLTYYFILGYSLLCRLVKKFGYFLLYLYVISTFTLSVNAHEEVHFNDDDIIARCYKSGDASNKVDFSNSHGISAFVDNCANTHICNDKHMFTFLQDLPEGMGDVGTIGGGNSPQGIGTVKWGWKDDLGQLHVYELENCKYFPDSPVNILATSQLGLQLRNSDRGTTICSGIYSSTFVWDEQQHSREIPHAANFLPSIKVDEHLSQYEKFLSLYNNFTSYYSSQAFLSSDHVYESMNLRRKHFLMGDNVVHKTADGDRRGFIISSLDRDCPTVQYDDGSSARVHVDVLEKCLPYSHTDDTSSNNLLHNPVQDTLSDDQREFLRWHHRLNHLPFHIMKDLAKQGILPKLLSKVKIFPTCAACLYGKLHKRRWRTTKVSNSIRKDHENFPGGCVSVDHLQSHQPGLVPQQVGILTHERIVGAVVFTDHFSNYTFTYLVPDLTGASTLEAKLAFERHAKSHGVTVLKYRADNGRFGDRLFVDHCHANNQTIDFCAVGAHHQNGIVERSIRDLTDNARTILIHAIRMWPEFITVMLWPYALRQAAARRNHLTPNANGFTPASQFSRTREPIPIHEFHTWGSPLYVLDARQQSANITIPKWDPKCRLGIYLGFSPYHASNVALVLNPSTGLVSPQFHVTFDDDFSTLPYLRSCLEPPHWENLVKYNSHLATDAPYTWSYTTPETFDHEGELASTSDEIESRSDTEGAVSTNENRSSTSTAEVQSRSENEGVIAPEIDSCMEHEGVPSSDTSMPTILNLHESGLRRSSRVRKATEKTVAAATTTKKKRSSRLFKALGLFTMSCLSSVSGITDNGIAVVNQHAFRISSNINILKNVDGTINEICPVDQVLAGIVDNEVYTFKDAMQQQDRAQFIDAMIKEANDHHDRGHWKIVKRAEANFPKTIQAVWSFKRKRHPDGSLNKHKARLCAHGGMQQWGVNYWETFSPVVNWMSVRLLLTISTVFDLQTRSIDFVLAFPQADLDVPVFMELPMGMEIPGSKKGEYVLELKKSLYGLKQASSNWFEKLKKGFEDRGFKSSDIDPCIFIRDDMIIISYVDDCVLISYSKDVIDIFIKDLGVGEENFVFTDDGDLKNYLGVEFTRNNTSINMKQEFLIQRIIDSIDFKETPTNLKDNPIVKPMLNKDIDGDPRKHDWNYRSVIGMLNYLEKTTRPDLATAVHQCARFCENPKRSHEKAVHRIIKYLISTKDKGLKFIPDKSKGIECYVDADFAGNWNSLDAENAANMLSRTGYVIFFMGCPLVWKSKLQTEIALSTTEAEYIALSQAMREIIPLMGILKELSRFQTLDSLAPKVKCTVFEDNQSCIKLAKAPRMNPRTKYIALKYHHFRSHVKQKLIDIEYVLTTEQIADIFTKPLSSPQFVYLREKLCGW